MNTSIHQTAILKQTRVGTYIPLFFYPLEESGILFWRYVPTRLVRPPVRLCLYVCLDGTIWPIALIPKEQQGLSSLECIHVDTLIRPFKSGFECWPWPSYLTLSARQSDDTILYGFSVRSGIYTCHSTCL